MDRKYIEENNIDTKYLRNQLSEQELEAFEVYLLENPDMLEQLELDAGLADGLENYKWRPDAKTRLLSWFKSPFSYAFSTIFLCLGFSLNNFYSHNSETVSQIAYLSDTRSSASSKLGGVRFEFDEEQFSWWENSQFVIVLQTGLSEEIVSDVLINFISNSADNSKSEKNPLLLKIEDLKPDKHGDIKILLSTKKFSPGKYLATISELGRGYIFEVKKR